MSSQSRAGTTAEAVVRIFLEREDYSSGWAGADFVTQLNRQRDSGESSTESFKGIPIVRGL